MGRFTESKRGVGVGFPVLDVGAPTGEGTRRSSSGVSVRTRFGHSELHTTELEQRFPGLLAAVLAAK